MSDAEQERIRSHRDFEAIIEQMKAERLKEKEEEKAEKRALQKIIADNEATIADNEATIADKEATIATLETEVTSLKGRLYEYEAKQTKLMKEVTEMKGQSKRFQEDMKRQQEAEAEKQREKMETRWQMQQSQMETLMKAQMQTRIDEILQAVMPTTGPTFETPKAATSTPSNTGTVPKKTKEESMPPLESDSNTFTSEEQEFSLSEETKEEAKKKEEKYEHPEKPEKPRITEKPRLKKKPVLGNRRKTRNVRKVKMQTTPKKRQVSLDSLDTNQDSSACYSSESEESVYAPVQKSILIREIAKITPFDVYDSKDVNEFFAEYEQYCRAQWPDNKKI